MPDENCSTEIGPGKIIGVNVRCYPKEGTFMGTHDENPPETVVVLVAGEVGDYAAYVGHGPPEWVARFGDKISFAEACCHFPGGQLKEELYRE